MQVSVPGTSYSNDSVAQRFYEPVLERVSAMPGVREAGWISALPLQTFGINGDFYIDGRPELRPRDAPQAEQRIVSAGYFHALGIPVLRGRAFEASDTRETSPVILVNQAAGGSLLRKRRGPCWP